MTAGRIYGILGGHGARSRAGRSPTSPCPPGKLIHFPRAAGARLTLPCNGGRELRRLPTRQFGARRESRRPGAGWRRAFPVAHEASSAQAFVPFIKAIGHGPVISLNAPAGSATLAYAPFGARRSRAVRAASQPGPPPPIPLPTYSFPSTAGASSARLPTRHTASGAVAPLGPNGPGGRGGTPLADVSLLPRPERLEGRR